MADLASAIQHLLKAKRITSASQSYAKDNPLESTAVFAYLNGGTRPANVTSEMGQGLVEIEDVRRGQSPPPLPEWTKVADENSDFSLTARSEVRYGAGAKWASKVLEPGTYACSNSFYGDPAPGVAKVCESKPSSAAPTALPKNTLISSQSAKVIA